MNHPNIPDLPPEIHLQILQYAQRNVLLSYSLVCRTLSTLVRPMLFDTLTFRSGPQITSHEFIGLIWGKTSETILPHVSKLQLVFSPPWDPYGTEHLLSLIQAVAPQITTLVLAGETGTSNKKSLDTVIPGPIFQQLRKLVLPHVQHLKLRGWYWIPYFSVLSGAKCLRSLEIDDCLANSVALPPIPHTILRDNLSATFSEVHLFWGAKSRFPATEPLIDLLRRLNAPLKSFRLDGYLSHDQIQPLLSVIRPIEVLSVGENWCKRLETSTFLSSLLNLRILEVHMKTEVGGRSSWTSVFNDLSRSVPPQLQQLHIVTSQETLVAATASMFIKGLADSYTALHQLHSNESCSLDRVLAEHISFQRLTFFVSRLYMQSFQRHEATSLLVGKEFARLKECGKYMLAWRWDAEVSALP
ncbi:hypothetical protein DL96DRAFT_1621586 [Flagelloscypha sp. PMI_526]|nr:hypothetical protein DL96DRAFT_1621586 [Flagelloscypha sp. PMI_526]